MVDWLQATHSRKPQGPYPSPPKGFALTPTFVLGKSGTCIWQDHQQSSCSATDTFLFRDLTCRLWFISRLRTYQAGVLCSKQPWPAFIWYRTSELSELPSASLPGSTCHSISTPCDSPTTRVHRSLVNRPIWSVLCASTIIVPLKLEFLDQAHHKLYRPISKASVGRRNRTPVKWASGDCLDHIDFNVT